MSTLQSRFIVQNLGFHLAVSKQPRLHAVITILHIKLEWHHQANTFLKLNGLYWILLTILYMNYNCFTEIYEFSFMSYICLCHRDPWTIFVTRDPWTIFACTAEIHQLYFYRDPWTILVLQRSESYICHISLLNGYCCHKIPRLPAMMGQVKLSHQVKLLDTLHFAEFLHGDGNLYSVTMAAFLKHSACPEAF